ncbi:MAG: hypothetical protein PHF70_11380 [Opitutales bacterium]|nr:hypothetical protein [Opitutales bacterium]
MVDILYIGPIVAQVEFKAGNNVHLSVYPPEGSVRIAAPGPGVT